MGKKVAPTFADIFMDALESKLLRGAPHKPYWWKRFIDYIFMIWTNDEDNLDYFLWFLNDFRPTIKFAVKKSTSIITFLDVTSVENGNHLKSKLYTDTHSCIHFSSHHPPMCKQGGSFGQFIRVRCNRTYDSDFCMRISDHPQPSPVQCLGKGQSATQMRDP